ncbi:uncharacterized protein LOC131298915 [Rhododendron vialii]|uniref:uncharacterized protein LOC131298915 n=1 Tax=Rhododendron vialii TaxID=182163 RepID=UPI00265FA3E1|nr:uncharacterized protein LOC131298915 [Rhododendron vialii]
MRRRREGEQQQLGISRRHMWSVPAADTSSSSLAGSDSAAVITPGGFYKDGRKICVGDCALFKPPKDSQPFIGVIRSLIVGKEENPRLSVNWLYRPADIKLGKTTLVEAAPNEVFYSFHRDEIPAASLLHPCKVTFLRKGVELPSGISSFVCRRVYDTENKCLWWLTDKDYTNERQEEVDQLLDKTRLEMYGAAQSEGRSPKPLNGQSGIQQLRPGSESIHNSTSPLPSQVKGKKRDRGEQASDPVKRERVSRGDDTDCGQLSPDNILRSEIAKITHNGGLVDFEGVEKFVQLMQPGTVERKLDLACRLMLVGVITVTDNFDCLGWFLQLRGLPVLDEWLQEVHKGKIGDVNNQKESDGSVEEFLLVSLRALDKLPVNLHALQTCNVGKSVNQLRSHKHSEIQKKARSLVDTWKKRVEAEMNIIDAKSGSSRGGSWPSRSVLSEVSHVGNNRRNGGTFGPTQSFACKTPCDKLGSASSTKSAASVISSGGSGKELNSTALVGGGSSDVPLATIKEEKSSSSSHSQNNSQSSSSDRGRSSTAGSVNLSKMSGGVSRLRKSNVVTQGSTVSGFQKETSLGKLTSLSRHLASEKLSPTRGTHDRATDVPPVEHGSSHRLIVRLPNTGRSPAPSANGNSFEDPTATVVKVSPSAQSEKLDHHDIKVKGKSDDALKASGASNTNMDEGNASSNVVPCSDRRTAEDGEKPTEVSKVAASPLGATTKHGESYDASFSPMNALVESCVQFSEASPTALGGGDDVGMNLLASVAAGEVSRSDVSRSDPEDSCSENDTKSRQFDDNTAQSSDLPDNEANDRATAGNSVDFSLVKNESQNNAVPLSTNLSGDGKVASICAEEKTGECSGQINSSSGDLQRNAFGSYLKSDGKPGLVKDDSVVLSSKDGTKGDKVDGEGADQLHAHRKSSAVRVRINNPSTSKLKGRSPHSDETEKVDKKVVESGAVKFPEDSACEKVEKDNEASPSRSCLDVGREDKRGILTEEKPPITANSHLESIGGEKDATTIPSGSVDFVCMEMKDEKAIESKAVSQTERSEKQLTDLSSSNLGQNKECVEEKSEPKDVSGHCPDGPTPHEEPSTNPVQQTEQCVKSIRVRLDETEAGGMGECSSSANGGSSVKLDFDLNESFPVDDGSQGEVAKSSVPGNLSPVYLCPLPFPVSSMSPSFPASVTVASAAKGPFFPPENLLKRKGELGWKGSAATSAFRPAEPRKVLEMPISTSDSPPVDSKKGRPRLDIDLNVLDETCLESGPLDCRGGGLGLDLNSVGECPDVGQFPVSNSHKLEIPQLSNRSSLSGVLPKSGLNASSRDFDLNNGPGFEEGPTETAPRAKNNVQFVSPIPGLRMNVAEQGNFSSWFAPPSNSYSAIAIPSVLSGRGEQSYPIVPATGSPRIMGPPSGGTSFGPEFYRGPVLSSAPAVPFSHAAPFQYAGFPFETNFPVSSNLYSGGSTAYDSSSGRPICFPSIPSQMVGPSGVVSSHYPRPYMVNLPGGTSNLGHENRKWGGQSLDLNTGPGGTDLERRDERLSSTLRQLPISGPQVSADEHMKMYQMAPLKRKEPDGGRDGDRASYKQSSWQ